MQNVKDAAHAIAEKVKGVTSGASFEANKEAATTNNYSTVEEKNNEAKKEATEERGVIGHIGDTLSNAYHYVAEKVHEATSVVSFENNKEKVKDSDNTVGERVTAACSAVGDKTEEKVHQAQAEAHKEAM